MLLCQMQAVADAGVVFAVLAAETQQQPVQQVIVLQTREPYMAFPRCYRPAAGCAAASIAAAAGFAAGFAAASAAAAVRHDIHQPSQLPF
jgi:hypothetical protein